MMPRTIPAFLIAGALTIALPSLAGPYEALATYNLTIQPAGPRLGANGLRFLNVEGVNNGVFASFGVAEFTVANLGIPGTVTDVGRLTLKLTSSNAAFSVSGPFDVWITQDNSTILSQVTDPFQSNYCPLKFDPLAAPSGVAAQLDPKWNLGSSFFDVTLGTGVAFDTDLVLSPAAKAYVISQLNSGSVLRVIVSNADAAGACTFAGYTNTVPTTPGPRLGVDAIVSGQTTLSGSVTFNDRVAAFPNFVTLEYRDTTDPSIVVHTAKVQVDASGNFITQNLPQNPGPYVLTIKPKPWLRKSVGIVNTIASASGLHFSLINGDINDDNSINSDDFDLLVANFGTASPEGDLDGSGSVDSDDFDILVKNFGIDGD